MRLALALLSCTPCGATETAALQEPRPLDYRTLPPMPRIPYVWEKRQRGKHLVVIGTRHLRAPDAPMFRAIENIFVRVRPDVVLHESEVPDSFGSMSREDAIRAGADAGFAVQAARRFGASVRFADASPHDEIATLLRRHPAGDVFVFLVVQRLIGTDQAPDWHSAATGYADFYANPLVAFGLPPHPEWHTWQGFLDEFRRVTGAELSPAKWNPRIAEPFRDSGPLSEIARDVDEIRDRELLAAMRDALRDHDRVIVVFGGAHVRAIEPVLATVMP